MAPLKHRRFVFEILLLACLITAGLLVHGVRSALAPVDAFFYDRLLPLAARAASTDIVIVAIDDGSLAKLGRWPWHREVHARLLEQLERAHPKAVMIDLFLTEPSDGDERLAAAMKKVPTYLPSLRTSHQSDAGVAADDFLPPVAHLAQAARGTGHAELRADPDGVARRLNLRQGPRGALKDYVGLQLARRMIDPIDDQAGAEEDWQLLEPMRIAYAGPRGSYTTVSYVSVLGGQVPSELLRGRFVLIGATAAGLGDYAVTPGAVTGGMLPGVEIHANAIDNLTQTSVMRELGDVGTILWTGILFWIAVWVMLRRERMALPCVITLAVGSTFASAMAMYERVWISPAGPVVSLLVMYLLWSWRRLRWQFDNLSQGTHALDQLPTAPFEVGAAPAAGQEGRAPSDRSLIDRAAGRLTRLQLLMDRALKSMPVGILICDESGVVRSSNPAARELLKHATPVGAAAAAEEPFAGIRFPSLLSPMQSEMSPRSVIHGGVFDPLARWAGEYVTGDAKILSVRIAHVREADQDHPTGYVVSLIDLTAERASERRREEWRRLLSHDLRSPQVNILSLLSLEEGGSPVPDLLASIKRESERTLSLSETFMDVADAEFGSYDFVEVHLGSLLADVRDQAAGYALRQGVTVELGAGGAEELMFHADGMLLRRAIVNLVNNAVRFSSRGHQIKICAAEQREPNEPSWLVLAVRDEGSGMDDALCQALLVGAELPERRQREGIASNYGVGWEIVRAVVRRHAGSIDGMAALGAGCTFWMRLPLRGSGTDE